MAVNWKKEGERIGKDFRQMANEIKGITSRLSTVMGGAFNEMTPEQRKQVEQQMMDGIKDFDPENIKQDAFSQAQEIFDQMNKKK